MRKKDTPAIEDKLLVDMGGEVDEYIGSIEHRKHVRFPVCLAIEGEGVEERCVDFVLSVRKKKLLIREDKELRPGTRLKMYFYVPETDHILCELEGEVGTAPEFENCVSVDCIECEEENIKTLIDYIEEKRHLIDEEV